MRRAIHRGEAIRNRPALLSLAVPSRTGHLLGVALLSGIPRTLSLLSSREPAIDFCGRGRRRHCCLFHCCMFHCCMFHCCMFHCCMFHCCMFHCCMFHCCMFHCCMFHCCMFHCCMFHCCMFHATGSECVREWGAGIRYVRSKGIPTVRSLQSSPFCRLFPRVRGCWGPVLAPALSGNLPPVYTVSSCMARSMMCR